MAFVRDKQKSAVRVAGTLVPRTWCGIYFRNFVARLFRGPLAVKLGIGNLVDDIELPDYEKELQVV